MYLGPASPGSQFIAGHQNQVNNPGFLAKAFRPLDDHIPLDMIQTGKTIIIIVPFLAKGAR